ncbi:ankyrin [Annulohypoxylon bovei var. microspora]|nr:ankyrin [Annulohypoxylon bovei var. microspora]
MANTNHSDPSDRRPRSMDLPAELLVFICHHLSLKDIKNWSYTRKHFYYHLLPILHLKDSEQEHKAAVWACRHRLFNVLDRALVAGSDVNHKYHLTRVPMVTPEKHYTWPLQQLPTLLHIATYYDLIDVMRFLLSRGANAKATKRPNFDGCTIFAEPMWLVRSPEAVNTLMSSMEEKRRLLQYSIINMVREWASLSTIETALDYACDFDSHGAHERAYDILVLACRNHRIDVFDLVAKWLHFDNESELGTFHDDTIGSALLPSALPMNENTIHQIIDRVFRLLNREPSTYLNKSRRCSGFTGISVWMGSLLVSSIEPWVPVSVTRRLLDVGMDPHARRLWPSCYRGHHERWTPRPSFTTPDMPKPRYIMGSTWQLSGTPLSYCLALRTMTVTARHQEVNREKAQILLEYGAGFEREGYPASFMLSTVTWPYSTRKIVDRISSLCGDYIFGQRNKYGETHLSSLLSWLSHSRQDDIWALHIARLLHRLLDIDQYKAHLTIIIGRHTLSAEIHQNLSIQPECQKGVIAIMDVLLKHGSCVNTKDTDGMSLLHWAAKLGSMERVSFLIDRGANIRDIDNHGFSPLHLASQFDIGDLNPSQSQGRVDIVRKLTDEGQTPLFIACQALSYSLVTELLCLGANILEDNYGRSPQDVVRHTDSQHITGHLFGGIYGGGDYIYDPQELVLKILNNPRARQEYRLPGYIGPDAINFLREP